MAELKKCSMRNINWNPSETEGHRQIPNVHEEIKNGSKRQTQIK